LDVIAEVVEGDGDLATGLVDPGADLRGLVDGNAGCDDNGRGDDDACGERAVRPRRRGMVVWRYRARAGACEQVGKAAGSQDVQMDTKKTWLRRAVVSTTAMHG
jgi:hypothetical protein